MQLWIRIPDYTVKEDNYKQAFDKIIAEKSYFYMEVKKSASVVEVINTISLPDNIIEVCREMRTIHHSPAISRKDSIASMHYNSELFNMVSSGKPMKLESLYENQIKVEGIKL